MTIVYACVVHMVVVCVSGRISPFPVGGLDLPVGHWQPIMVHRVRVSAYSPLAVRYYELWRSEWLRDICVDTVLHMQH